MVSSLLPGAAIDETNPTLRTKLKPEALTAGAPAYAQLARSDDRTLVDSARHAAATWYTAHKDTGKLVGPPLGWDDVTPATVIWRREIDWVLAARETWRASLHGARDASAHGGEALVGPLEGPERNGANPTWRISDALLFTDQMPNADIVNH